MSKQLVHFVEWKKVPDEAFDSTLEALCSWGVTDIVAHPVWSKRDREQPGYLADVARKIAAAGLKTPACHALWGKDYDLARAASPEHEAALQQHKEFLRQLAGMDVKTYTIHLSCSKEESLEVNWSRIMQSVEALLPVAEETGIILALENSGGDSMELMDKLTKWITASNHPQLGLCYDTGHANCYSPLGVFGTLDIMRPAIVTCHMHDNYGSFDDHNPPGGGNLDWAQLVPALKSCPRMLHAETESGDWDQASWKKFVEVWEA